MTKAWERFEIDFTHASIVNDTTHISTLDHFFWNEVLEAQILDAGVIILWRTSLITPRYSVLFKTKKY